MSSISWIFLQELLYYKSAVHGFIWHCNLEKKKSKKNLRMVAKQYNIC